MRPSTMAHCEECAILEQKLDDLHVKQEAYSYLRSRLAEVKDGDGNTKYFHHKASQHKQRNFIKGVFDSGGLWQTDDEKIEEEVENYFNKFFTSDNPSTEYIDELLQHLQTSIKTAYNEVLLKLYTKEEIYPA